MNIALITGTTIVTFALISYTIGIAKEQKEQKVTTKVLTFLTLGIILDISATTCMIIGSSNSPFTIHGFIGYSALTAMVIDTILIWRINLKNEKNKSVSKTIHLYSRYAYAWWVLVYISGGIFAIL